MASEANIRLNVTGFVLAGGRSSRMGSDKALLPFRDSNFLHHALETLSAACRRPAKAVVSPHKAPIYEKLLSPEAVITDEYPDHGALGGIHAALAHCETDFALVLAVDLPKVEAPAAEALIALAAGHNGLDALIPEQDDGRLQPLFAIYRVDACLPKIEALFSKQSDCSVRDLLARIKTVTVTRAQVDIDPNLLLNVNDSASYEILKKTS